MNEELHKKVRDALPVDLQAAFDLLLSDRYNEGYDEGNSDGYDQGYEAGKDSDD